MKRQIEGVAEQLLDCAAKEFLDKGFADASLREIAKQCGVSTHSIYTRFQDKAGLFDAVVEQTLKDIEDLKRSFYERNYKRLDDHTLMQMWDMSLETHQYWINYFYDRFEDMKLLLCSAQGSHHADFCMTLLQKTPRYVQSSLKRRGTGTCHTMIFQKKNFIFC